MGGLLGGLEGRVGEDGGSGNWIVYSLDAFLCKMMRDVLQIRETANPHRSKNLQILQRD